MKDTKTEGNIVWVTLIIIKNIDKYILMVVVRMMERELPYFLNFQVKNSILLLVL